MTSSIIFLSVIVYLQLRMNFKDSILNSTTIFAHAAGFKVSWEVPEGVSFKGRRIRALQDDIEFLFDR